MLACHWTYFSQVPSWGMVIVRVGEQARGWDEAALPNVVLRGLSAT